MKYLPILLVSFLWTATLFAQANPSVVYIEGNPSSAPGAVGGSGGFNPYPGIGTIPSGTTTEIPTTTLYPENTNDATFGLPASPTRRTSELFFTNGQVPRDGLFQKVNFNVLWAPKGSGDSAVGLTVLDLSATFALPFPTKESPLVLTPLFQTWFFHNSNRDGSTFYTAGLDIRWFTPIIKNKFSLDLGVAPLYSGDFKTKKKSFRIPAHLAGVWTCNPRTKFVFGVLYQDRSDSYRWMPTGGVIWTPNEDIGFELTYPKLRISQRIKWWGSVAGDSVSDWLYGGFEFNGGSWGYEIFDGYDTQFDYRDYRLLLGYERRCLSGLTIALEIGWMFDRRINLDGSGGFHPDDAFFLQLKTAF